MRRSFPTFSRGSKSKTDDAWWEVVTYQDTETDDEIWESASEDAWWERNPTLGQRKAGGANKPQNKQQRLQDRLVVAVMGSTGAGKSSFVKLVTGRSDVQVGHSLHSSASSSLTHLTPE